MKLGQTLTFVEPGRNVGIKDSVQRDVTSCVPNVAGITLLLDIAIVEISRDVAIVELGRTVTAADPLRKDVTSRLRKVARISFGQIVAIVKPCR